MVTLKSYYRKRRRLISDAERRRIPVFVLRANTVSQMENFLAQALNLNGEQEEGEDPFDVAMAEAQRAIEEINAGKPNVSLSPVNSDLRAARDISTQMLESETSDPGYAKIYTAYTQWRDAAYRWFGTAEQTYAAFAYGNARSEECSL
jgi:hypothetical protein